MKNSKMLLLAATTTVFWACTAQPENNADTKMPDSSANVQTVNETAYETNNEILNAILPHYFNLESALVKADTQAAQESALLVDAGMAELKDAPALRAASSALLSAKSLEAQRIAFEPLTEALIAQVKVVGLKAGALYVVNCPMAFNNKGANWLAAKKEVVNPYFGDQMLNCGSVTETIN